MTDYQVSLTAIVDADDLNEADEQGRIMLAELARKQAITIEDTATGKQYESDSNGITEYTPPDTSKPNVDDVATVDEALTLIRALRGKFGMVGVEFTVQDIRDHLTSFEEVQSITDPEQRAATEEALVGKAVEDRAWYRLDDALAEYGNEIIATLLVGLLPNGGDRE